MRNRRLVQTLVWVVVIGMFLTVVASTLSLFR
jgi:hypothetical protein